MVGMSAWLMLMQMVTAALRHLGMMACNTRVLKITCMMMMAMTCSVATAAAVRGSQQQGVQQLVGFKWWHPSSLPVQQQQQRGAMQLLPLVEMIMMAGRGMRMMAAAGSSSSRTGGSRCWVWVVSR
jgi:hypothetical protein